MLFAKVYCRPSHLARAGALLAVLGWGAAQAALDVERTTVLHDRFGGEFSALTTGQVDLPGRNLNTEARFTDFHLGDAQTPSGEHIIINGRIERSQQRGAGVFTALLNGDLEVSGGANSGREMVTLSFSDLQILVDGMGREFSGTVTVNGEVFDAAAMPGAVVRILRRTMRFLRYY